MKVELTQHNETVTLVMAKEDFFSLIQNARATSSVAPQTEEPKSIHYKGMKQLTKDFLDELRLEFGNEPFSPKNEAYRQIKFKHRITSPNTMWKKLQSQDLISIVWSTGVGEKGHRIKSIRIKC
jgi:hypothetical protein